MGSIGEREDLTQAQTSVFALELVAVTNRLAETVKVFFQ